MDFHTANHGTLVILIPLTDAAQDWCREHLPADCPRWGMGFAIEANYFWDIREGILESGLDI